MSLDFYLKNQGCSHCGREGEEVFWRNISHNLGKMALDAKIYDCLWGPDENGFKYAYQIIEKLSLGLENLRNNPEHFKQFDAPNGWGVYEDFVSFVEAVLEACLKYPEAEIEVSR